jgi:hypothetical protein
MKNIYSKANRVIGWLGLDENGGSQALKTFETLFRNAIHYPDKFEWVRRMPELLKVNGTYAKESGITVQSNDRLEKLLLLLKRPFWRRIWILQELVLPLNLRLLCGEEFTDIPKSDLFFNIVNKLTKQPDECPTSLPINMWMRLNECIARLRLLATLRSRHSHGGNTVDRAWEGWSGFINARILLEFHETSDPRDHVYGLLGLYDLDIVPDYGEDMTVADVYLEVARHCLRTETLDILSLANIAHSSNGSDRLTHLGLPSWVPDWTLPNPATARSHRYPQSHAFPPKGGLRMQVIDHKWLRGPGVVWDTVSSTEHKTGRDLSEWDLAEKVDIEKPGEDYPSNISRFQAIVILWLGGYDGLKTPMCDLRPDSELFRSYEVIFIANIAQPWANKHGRHNVPKLINHIFGQNGPKSVPIGHRESYVTRSRQLRHGMRCFHTEKGYVGFGPLTTEVGDLVCILEGHKAPVLLHRRGSHYLFIGDCDVVGIMNGEVLEAVKRGEAEIIEIEIR